MTQFSIAALLRHDLARYFITSLLALAVDIASLSACLRLLHLSLAWSASIGFALGAIVAYVLSIRWVFRDRTYGNAPALEFATFVAIGIAGLGLTQLVLWAGTLVLHLLPEAVKLAAAGLTFVFNYLVRKSLLFVSARRSTATGKGLA